MRQEIAVGMGKVSADEPPADDQDVRRSSLRPRPLACRNWRGSLPVRRVQAGTVRSAQASVDLWSPRAYLADERNDKIDVITFDVNKVVT
jgi:hypothetical protein